MKNVKILLGFVSLLLTLPSCNKDDNNTNRIVQVSAKSTFTGLKTGKSAASVITLSLFKVNINEIKFKYENENEDNHNGDDNHDGFFDGEDNFKLIGPFELDLLGGQVDLIATDIPQEVYEEVEFKLAKNTNSSAPLFSKSIEIRGTINGTPFVFWHDIEEKVEVDYKNVSNNITIGQNSVSIVFNFNLDEVFANIDLTLAKDGNGDGVIEISPIDPDGNQDLAHLLKDKIEEFTELED